MSIHRHLAAALVVFWTYPAVAEEWPVARGPSTEPEPYQYDPADQREVPGRFLTDVRACLLHYSATYMIESDGTAEEVYHEVARVNSRKGVEAYGEYRSVSYHPGFQKLTLNLARVHKPDGRVFDVGPGHLQLRDTATDYQVYDPGKELIISLPKLHIGDVVEVKWTVRGRNPEFGKYFIRRYPFGSADYPIVVDQCRVILPKGVPLRHAVVNEGRALGGVTASVRETDSRRVYTWRTENTPPMPATAGGPTAEETQPTLALSTFPDWRAVADWERNLRAECWECTPELAEMTREITAGLTTPEEKAKALTYWVRGNVRYVSLGVDHGFRPFSATEVFNNRFGDCKDAAQLLAVMLRQVGIESEAVTIGYAGDGQVLESVPSPEASHAILAVNLDGEAHYIDLTTPSAEWDFLMPGCRDRAIYAVGESDIRLGRTPPMTAEDNRVESVIKMQLKEDGRTLQLRTDSYHGLAAYWKREAWHEEPEGTAEGELAQTIAGFQPTAKVSWVTVDPMGNRDKPVRATMWVIDKDHLGGVGGHGYLSVDALWDRLVGLSVPAEGEEPYLFDAPFAVRYTYELHTPIGFRLTSPPAAVEMKKPFGGFSRTVEALEGGDGWRMVVEARLDRPRIEPGELKEFAEFHDFVTSHYQFYVGLRPAEPAEAAADANRFRQGMDLETADADEHAQLARLYARAQLPELAVGLLRPLLETERFRDHRVLTELLAEVVDAPERLRLYARLHELHPEEPKFRLTLADAHREAGRLADARKLLAPLAKSDDPAVSGGARLKLARVALAEGDAEQALKHYQLGRDAAGHDGTLADITFGGRIHEALGDAVKAREAYTRVFQIDYPAVEALEGLIRLSLRDGDRVMASRYLRQLAIRAENDAELTAKAAEWYLKLDRIGEAAALAEEAQLAGSPPSVHRILGLVRFRQKRFAEAIGHLEQGEMDARSAAALLHGYLKLGRVGDARKKLASLDGIESPELKKLSRRIRKLAERRDENR